MWSMRKMKAKEVKVIRTETVEGKGIKEDPVRTVIRYWAKNGELIGEKQKEVNNLVIETE